MSSINSSSTRLTISNFNTNQSAAGVSLERLATGQSINRAADNPSGLIATGNFVARLESIGSQLTSIERTQSNLSITEGVLGSTLENIADLGSLVLGASSAGGLSASELSAAQTQISGSLSGIDHLASGSGLDILSDVSAEMVVGTDPTTGDPITETVTLSDLSRVLETDPAAAQALVDGARDAVLTRQAEIGTQEKEQDAMARVLQEEQINVARAASQTRDTDYARESSKLIRDQILGQASIYTMLAARQSSKSVLSLLNINA